MYGGDPLAESAGVLLAQVNLVLRAAEPEPHRLDGRAAIQIVFELDRYPLRHPEPPRPRLATCTVQDQPVSSYNHNAAGGLAGEPQPLFQKAGTVARIEKHARVIVR
jgi:hypothetical protein